MFNVVFFMFFLVCLKFDSIFLINFIPDIFPNLNALYVFSNLLFTASIDLLFLKIFTFIFQICHEFQKFTHLCFILCLKAKFYLPKHDFLVILYFYYTSIKSYPRFDSPLV
jgi:hypothetical protein